MLDLSPAVSVRMTLYPSKLRFAYMRSRVVPGMSDTIATYLFARRLSKVDFPAFGGPMIDILRPSRIISVTFC